MPNHVVAMRPRPSALVAAVLSAVLALVTLPALVGRAGASPTELFFSEYVEGTSFDKALEIYNGTGAAVNLAAGSYDVFMSFNGGTSTAAFPLTGTVAAGDVYVLAPTNATNATIVAQADQTAGTAWFNGDDFVALRKGGVVVDSIGQLNVDPGVEWGSGDTSTQDNTLRRKATILAGDTNTGNAFDPAVEWDGFPVNTFGGLGSHSTAAGDQPVQLFCPVSTRTTEGEAGSFGVIAQDTDDPIDSLAVTSAPVPGITLDVSSTLPTAVGEMAFADVSVADTTAVGVYNVTITATNTDVPEQTGSCTVEITVSSIETIPIGDVQGSVPDSATGRLARSPFAPASGNGAGTTEVTVTGVVHQRTLARSSAGVDQHGFFLQNTVATDDDDPTTSDGIFVFMGASTSLPGGYTPVVGDEIRITARVSEFFFLTQLSGSTTTDVDVIRTGVDLDLELPAFDVNPPDDSAAADRYWERREGMRGTVPAGALAVDGRDVFAGTFDSEQWVIRGDHPVASIPDAYSRRVFRDPHPLDNQAGTFDDGNGYRIMLASLGVKATAGDSTTLLTPIRTFDTITNALTGGVYYSFEKYSIQAAQQPVVTQGPDPAANHPPVDVIRSRELTVANYNVENLYDYRDDPFDGCDFVGNAGCPGVSPPFNYVPPSDADYQARLTELATQITLDLRAPDIVMVQEVEDQDFCTSDGVGLTCGALDDADGKPDTLQELANVIAELGGPTYDAAYDRDGADDRGITAAFLYRTDRVEVLPADPGDPVLGSAPTVAYPTAPAAFNVDVSNPKALNAAAPPEVFTDPTGRDGSNVFTRAPQVGHFRVWRDSVGAGVTTDLWLVSNHFSSTPNARVVQRTQQAAYNAAIVGAIEAADPGARVLVGGDLNVYPRPDDPFPPPALPSDQLGPLYDAGLANLYDVLLAEAPSSAYGYVFQGQTQTLDQMFVNAALRADLIDFREAHVNADFPADYDGDGARGVSDHDPQVATFAATRLEDVRALIVEERDAGRFRRGHKSALEIVDVAIALRHAGEPQVVVQYVMFLLDQYLAGLRQPNQIQPATAQLLRAEAQAYYVPLS